MQADDQLEFFDVAQRNKKYGMVDRENGAILLEKYYAPLLLALPQQSLTPSCLQGHSRRGCGAGSGSTYQI